MYINIIKLKITIKYTQTINIVIKMIKLIVFVYLILLIYGLLALHN